MIGINMNAIPTIKETLNQNGVILSFHGIDPWKKSKLSKRVRVRSSAGIIVANAQMYSKSRKNGLGLLKYSQACILKLKASNIVQIRTETNASMGHFSSL